MERRRSEIAAEPVDGDTRGRVFVTASFGLATLAPDIPVEQSIDRADKALLRAKTEGRNCVRVWEPAVSA